MPSKKKKELIDLSLEKLEDDPAEKDSKSLAELMIEAGKKFGEKEDAQKK